MPKIKTSPKLGRGRPIKNKLAEPIYDTPENVMRAVLGAKPKATDYWYERKPRGETKINPGIGHLSI